MNFNNYLQSKNNEKFILILLVILSIIIRIPVILEFGDTRLDNEWLILINNLKDHGTLSLVGDWFTPSLEDFNGYVLPNLWMPPLYAYYIYFFTFFNLDEQNYILLILLSQAFLGSITIIIFYKINKLFFSNITSLFTSILFSIFPLYVYASSQISSICLHTFLLMIFYYYFFRIADKKNFLSIFLFSFTAGLIILTRYGEQAVILLFSSFYLFFFFKVQIKKILLIFTITLITISPYLTRNVLIFDNLTINKSFGFNLWKGNNINSGIEGSFLLDDSLEKKIDAIPKDRFYRINFDKIFLDEAIKNLTKDPKEYSILFLKKATSFFFVDMESSHSNYYHPINFLFLLVLGFASLIGIILSNKKSYKLVYIFFILLIIITIYSCFFILPRYKLTIIPLQLIFTGVLIEYLKNKFFTTSK